MTYRSYNINGEFIGFTRPGDSGANNRRFATNQAGQIVTSLSGNLPVDPAQLALYYRNILSGTSTVHSQMYRYANGQFMGTFGQLQSSSPGVVEANFDVNFEPISSRYPAPTPSQYTVQSGDTLRAIATRIFGDGGLWYVIADANGLTIGPNDSLTEMVGQSLRIPNEVVAISNTADSFKPFNVGDALGETSPIQPALPPPRPKKGCGIVGMIIMVIVAVVVTVLSWGTMGPVMAAMLGSVASQLVGMAIGAQDKFSWKAVALAGITAGITAGTPISTIGTVVGEVTNSIVGAAVQAVVNNAVGQGVAIAMGMQDKFNWRSLAVSAVSAPIANWASGKVGAAIDSKVGAAGSLLSRNLSDATTSVVRAGVTLAMGGKVDVADVVGDIFGNFLGNSIVQNVPVLRDKRDWREGMMK
jgi:hypothetical protein